MGSKRCGGDGIFSRNEGTAGSQKGGNPAHPTALLGTRHQPVQLWQHHPKKYSFTYRDCAGQQYVAEDGLRKKSNGRQTLPFRLRLCYVGTTRNPSRLILLSLFAPDSKLIQDWTTGMHYCTLWDILGTHLTTA